MIDEKELNRLAKINTKDFGNGRPGFCSPDNYIYEEIFKKGFKLGEELSWNSVNKKLPETEDFCLVYTLDEVFDFAFYSQVEKQWYWNCPDTNTIVNCSSLITHWKELTKPV